MKYLLPFLAAFFLASCVSSKRMLFLDTAPAPGTDAVDVSQYEQKYGTYDGVYLNIQRKIDHFGVKNDFGFGGTWKYTYVTRGTYIVFNPGSQKLTTFSLYVPRWSDIGTVSLHISRPDGSHAQYGLKDMVSEKDSYGNITYKFVYPNVTKGCIIDEAFDMTYNSYPLIPSLDFDIALQLQIPCEHFIFQFAYPDWWDITIKNTGSAPAAPVTQSVDAEKRKKILTCETSNLPAYRKEEFTPYYKEISSYLEFMITQLEMAGARYESPKNWNDIVSRYKDEMLDRNGFLSNRVSKTTQALIQNKTEPGQMIDTIVSFIQKNIHVTNDGEDRNFVDILDDKKGNAYAVTGLAHSMLKKAGFKPEFVLVHSAEEGYCDEHYYNISQFSIPAVVVPVVDKEYVLTPYRKDTQFDQIPEILQGQKALIFSEKDENKFRTIPDEGGAANQLSEYFDASISETGTVTVDETDSLGGTVGYYIRSLIEKSPAEERETFVKTYLSNNGLEAILDSFSFVNEQDYKAPLVIRIKFHSDNLVTVTDDEVIFQPAGLFSPTTIKDSKIEIEERKNPIRIYFNENLTKSVALHFPEQWNISTELSPLSIENDFGRLTITYTGTHGLLTADLERSLKRTAQPKEKIADLTALVGRDSKTTVPSIVFKHQ